MILFLALVAVGMAAAGGDTASADGPWPDLRWGDRVPEDAASLPACAKRLKNYGMRGIVVDRLADFSWARGVTVSAPRKTLRSWRGFDLTSVCYLHREGMVGFVGEVDSRDEAVEAFRRLWGEPEIKRSGIPAEANGAITEREWTLPNGQSVILRTYKKQEFSRRGDEYFWEWTDLLVLAPAPASASPNRIPNNR